MIRLVVIGAAGFGREVLDVVDALKVSEGGSSTVLAGVVDDGPSQSNLDLLRRRGVCYLGTIAEWLDRGDDAHFVVGIGRPALREQVTKLMEANDRRAMVLVHPSATLGYGVTCEPGVVVCAGVQVSNEVRLGAHSHLNPNATIGHDATLEQFVSVNPGAVISGACHIDRCSTIGAGAVVLQGLRVGAGAVVGAAACVTHDIEPGATVMGVPAR